MAFLAAACGAVEAGSRNVGVGIGVGAGLLLLDQLSKSKSGKKSSSKKRRNDEAPRTSKAKKQPRDVEESQPETASKASDDKSSNGADTPAVGAQPAATAPPVTTTATTAPAATAALPAPLAVSSNVLSTPDEITSAQEHLRFLGYDVAATTGVLDLNTKIAIMKFQDAIGAPATGELTVQQLQRLYVLADERRGKLP